MVVQSDYPPAGYHGYGAAAAYQCSNPYATAVGPGGYPTPVSGGYSTSPASCYSMPPPQHIPQHDKTKDRLVEWQVSQLIVKKNRISFLNTYRHINTIMQTHKDMSCLPITFSFCDFFMK